MEMQKQVPITAKHYVRNGKRIVAFNSGEAFIGTIVIPGKPSSDSCTIREVDLAWRMLISQRFVTEHLPEDLRTILQEVTADYSAANDPVMNAFQRVLDTEFDNDYVPIEFHANLCHMLKCNMKKTVQRWEFIPLLEGTYSNWILQRNS